MNLKKSETSLDTEACNQMQFFVKQHLHQMPPDLTKQFKKLFIQRFISENIFIFIIQYIGLTLGTVSLNPTPLWLATGSSCAYLFLRGYSVMPGIFLGTLCAYLLAKAALWTAFLCASLFVLQAILLFMFCYRFLGPTLIFYNLKSFTLYILYTLILTGLISYLLLSTCYTALSTTKPMLELGLQWWLANFNGVIIFSSGLLTLDAYFLDFYKTDHLKNKIWLLGIFFILIAALLLSSSTTTIVFLGCMILLFTACVSFFYHWCAALGLCFLLGIILCFAILFDAPLFTSTLPFLAIEGFLSITTLLALGIAIRFEL